MQPQLVATSEETTRIMEKIEVDKVDVDAKKELVQADEAVANKAAMEAKAIKPDFLLSMSKLNISKLNFWEQFSSLVLKKTISREKATHRLPR